MVVMLKVTGLKQSSVNMTQDLNFNTGQEQSSVNMSERHIKGSNCNNRQKQSSVKIYLIVIQQTHQEQNEITELQSFN